MVGVVLGRVVGGEERPAVEEQPAGPLAPADDGDGVGRVPQLGPRLRQVFGPLLDVLRARRRTRGSRGADMNRRQRSCALRSQVDSISAHARSNSLAVRLRECGPGRRRSPSRCRCCDSRRRTPYRPAEAIPARPGHRGPAGR